MDSSRSCRQLRPAWLPPQAVLADSRVTSSISSCCCFAHRAHSCMAGAAVARRLPLRGGGQQCWAAARKNNTDDQAGRRESPRWNPTKEQLRALEELYARGTRTPPAHQIQLIAAQLRRYGRIEGKNVFYWFQNHKARERQRQRREAVEAAATATAQNPADSRGAAARASTVEDLKEEHSRSWAAASAVATGGRREGTAYPPWFPRRQESPRRRPDLRHPAAASGGSSSSTCSNHGNVELGWVASAAADGEEHATLELFPMSSGDNDDDADGASPAGEPNTSPPLVQFFRFL